MCIRDRSNHASVVKYIAAEDQKCNVGTDKVFGVAVDNSTASVDGTSFQCDGRTGSTVITAAKTALKDFKNPYSPDSEAVRTTGTAHAAKADMGFVNVEASDDTITVTTCYQNDCAASTDDVVNTVEVGE